MTPPNAHPARPLLTTTRSASSPVLTAERPAWRDRRAAHPLFVVTCAWLLAAAFAFYRADEVHRRVVSDAILASRPEVVELAARLDRLAAQTPIPAWRAQLDGFGATVRGAHPGLTAKAPTPAAPATGKVQLASHRLHGRTALVPRQRRILLVGASSMEFYLGAELERSLEEFRGVEVRRFAKLGTGLARPDLFDWPKAIAALSADFKPDVVIAQFGGNEAQPIQTADGAFLPFGTRAWDAEYRRRVATLVEQVRRSGARMVLLGVQITRHRKISRQFGAVNDLIREESGRRGADFIPTWDLGADAAGGPRATIELEGETHPLYLRDGVHYSRPGARWLVARLSHRLEALLELTPEDPAVATVRWLEHRSRLRGKVVRSLVWMPQKATLDGERPAALLLLHGAGGGPSDFAVHAHGLLRAFAGSRRVAVIAPDGEAHGWYVDSFRVPGARIASYLVDELMPHLTARLGVSAQRSVAGISMGGNAAVVLALRRPELFAAASAMSGAVDLSEAHTRAALIERLGPYAGNEESWQRWSAVHVGAARPGAALAVPVLLTVGRADRWAPANRRLYEVLSLHGSSVDLEVLNGGHDWTHWTEVLPRHLEWHARMLGRPAPN